MREIIWAEEARAEYRGAIAYLAPRNPDAAERLSDLINRAVYDLACNPTGRRGRVVGTYEKVLQKFPYIIAYELDQAPEGERLMILGIIHAKRDWISDHWPEGDR